MYTKLYDKQSKVNYMPVFKDAPSYANAKIKMLREDFCIFMTAEDEAYVRKCTTERSIDQACTRMINKYWG